VLETGDVFDKLAFLGLSSKELVAQVASSLVADHKRRHPAWAFSMPQRSDVEKRAAELAARYGGKLGGMTRKNFCNAVWKEIVRIYRREAKAEGKSLYLWRG
jgi:hypothetical protein